MWEMEGGGEAQTDKWTEMKGGIERPSKSNDRMKRTDLGES
jgi:hypothetical protein